VSISWAYAKHTLSVYQVDTIVEPTLYRIQRQYF